ncbi:MAG: hypothetical protein JEZ12_20400 [Desulfobacterium sp.]|nr:hypothetical protein [Desulfobacterium sp.]
MKYRIAFLAAGILAGFVLSSQYHGSQQKQVVAGGEKIDASHSRATGLEKPASTPVHRLEKAGPLGTETEPDAKMPGNDFVDPLVLADRFPGNIALPPVTAEARERKKRERSERNLEFGKIVANKSTEQEILAYYDHQRQLSEDSKQILEFVLARYGDRFSEKNIKKHEFMLAQFKKKLEYIPVKESEAIARLRTRAEE